MAYGQIVPKRNEDLTPKERAKKFSTGTFTATQTGARGQALERSLGISYGMESDGHIEGLIAGKKKKG